MKHYTPPPILACKEILPLSRPISFTACHGIRQYGCIDRM
jgi:hypothetical protein